jgi:hypothetical protein
MSAKPYSVETLLEGKHYRSHSRRLEGTIQEASKSDAWYGSEFQAYKIRVRPTYSVGTLLLKDFWATVVVKVGE